MSKTITITKENALRAYNSTDDTGKELLSNLLGKEHFGKIQDRVKTFEDALSISGLKEQDVLNSSMNKADIAEAKLKLIIKVLNEEKAGNPLYYPYFCGGSWVVRCCRYYDGAFVPVSQAFRLYTSELAVYVGEQFKDLYKIYMGYE